MSEQIVANPANNVKTYCVRCRGHVIVTNPETVLLKSNQNALKGKCPHCNSMTFKIISKKAA